MRIDVDAGSTGNFNTHGPVRFGADEIPVDFPELPRSVHPGERILLDDGNLELRLSQCEPEIRVRAQVIVGGYLKSHKGISLPEAHLDISALTDKDLMDLEFGLKLGVDAVALSLSVQRRIFYTTAENT